MSALKKNFNASYNIFHRGLVYMFLVIVLLTLTLTCVQFVYLYFDNTLRSKIIKFYILPTH